MFLWTSCKGQEYESRSQALDKYLERSIMVSGISDIDMDKKLYGSIMDMIKDLRPKYLSRVAGYWGLPERQMIKGGNLFRRNLDVIEDINRYYRDQKIDMPIIEAGIYEAITSDINNVRIPEFVSENFDYEVKNSSFFNVDSMKNDNLQPWSEESWTPDITKIQTRMWFFYLSTLYIDMGCESIHMGWFDRTFKNDTDYSIASDLFDRVRIYGKERGKIVFINADTDKPLFRKGTNKLILDFISSPLRPEPNSKKYECTPCQGQPMAELNFEKYLPDVLNFKRGITPKGDTITDFPVLFNLDWFGVGFKGYPPNLGLGDGFSPWNVNEIIWFFNLTEECQIYWFKNAVKATNKSIRRGYLKIPGIEPLTWWGFPEKAYNLVDYSEFYKYIKYSLWNSKNLH